MPFLPHPPAHRGGLDRCWRQSSVLTARPAMAAIADSSVPQSDRPPRLGRAAQASGKRPGYAIGFKSAAPALQSP